MTTTETVTEYAAIHPRFPLASKAHAWTTSRDEAVEWATAMAAAVGQPVRVSARVTTVCREYLPDSICH